MYLKIYKYKVLKDNSIVEGYINASCIKDAVETTKHMSLKQVSVRRSFYSFHRAKSDQIAEWFLTLSTLLKEGIKIESCLEIMKQNPRYPFSSCIFDLIKSGFSFAAAIKRHSFFFGPVCIKTIDSISEFMGIEEICFFLYNYHSILNSKIANAKRIITQPMITFTISTVILLFAIAFLKNNTEQLFLELGVRKPLLFKVIDMLTSLNLVMLASIISILFLNLKFFLVKIPFIRSYYENLDIFISFYCISKALSSGIKIINAIDIALEATQTKNIFMKLKGVKNSILNGKSLYTSFKRQNFNVEFCEMMRVGEKTGQLQGSFMSISSLAENKLSKQFELISNTLPYLFLLFTAFLVISFFFSIFVPIYSSVNKFFF